MRLLGIVIFFIMALPIRSLALDEIDVLVAFSSDSGLTNFQKVETVGRYQRAVNTAFKTIKNRRTANLFVVVNPVMPYIAANKTDEQAISWMKAQNSNIASPLRIARETSGSGGSDLVLMCISRYLTLQIVSDSCS